MIKNIIANGIGTYTDFDLYISSRDIPFPQNKEIFETVPFMNGSYNFSYLDGEIAKEDRTISYKFDIAEYTVEEMDLIKRKVANWLSTIVDTDIYDEYIPNYHFHGTALVPDWSEENSLGEITIKFKVYPYLIANEPKKYNGSLSSKKEIIIENNSSHNIYPTIECSNNLKITCNSVSLSLVSGKHSNVNLKLIPGNNNVTLEGNTEYTISFIEEVL